MSAVRLVVVGLVAAAVLGACGPIGDRGRAERGPDPEDLHIPGADPERGRQAIRDHGCIACHVIPGVRGAAGQVGPPLDGFRHRGVIAGRLPNTGENLTLWILDPQGVSPGNAMPNLPLTDREARDIAAYLLSLR